MIFVNFHLVGRVLSASGHGTVSRLAASIKHQARLLMAQQGLLHSARLGAPSAESALMLNSWRLARQKVAARERWNA
jgi:hypothetical protein